jgi:CheY-like chemotaxis protein
VQTFNIMVKDMGASLTKEQQAKLFKPTCADPNQTDSHGLGLNICKKIALNIGGDLNYLETNDQGCTFLLQVRCKLVKTNFEVAEAPLNRTNLLQ